MILRPLTAIILLFLISLLASSPAVAKNVLYTGDPIVVKVSYLSPVEVRFTGDEIASIVTGIQPSDISIQNAANVLYIQPLIENLQGDIYVVMRDGTSKIVSLVTVPPAARDRVINIIHPSLTHEERAKKVTESGLTPAGLIKAMALREDVDGVSISTDSFVLEGLGMTVTETYDAVFMKGYVIPLNNKNIDLKNIIMKKLIAGAIYNGNLYLVVGN